MAYAMTRIMTGAEVEKLDGYHPGGVGIIHKREFKEIGDKVTQEELGVDDATWEGYFAEGVVSETKPPKDWNPEQESLTQFETRVAVEQLEATTSTAQAERVQRRGTQKEEEKES